MVAKFAIMDILSIYGRFKDMGKATNYGKVHQVGRSGANDIRSYLKKNRCFREVCVLIGHLSLQDLVVKCQVWGVGIVCNYGLIQIKIIFFGKENGCLRSLLLEFHEI